MISGQIGPQNANDKLSREIVRAEDALRLDEDVAERAKMEIGVLQDRVTALVRSAIPLLDNPEAVAAIREEVDQLNAKLPDMHVNAIQAAQKVEISRRALVDLHAELISPQRFSAFNLPKG